MSEPQPNPEIVTALPEGLFIAVRPAATVLRMEIAIPNEGPYTGAIDAAQIAAVLYGLAPLIVALLATGMSAYDIADRLHGVKSE
jgi:hypothetical protein